MGDLNREFRCRSVGGGGPKNGRTIGQREKASRRINPQDALRVGAPSNGSGHIPLAVGSREDLLAGVPRNQGQVGCSLQEFYGQ